MGSVRVTVVSDSHLSELTPEATANWDRLVDHVDRTEPDAVIHTGDIALDGTAGGAELDFARRHLDRMGPKLLALPGNHDLGDNPCETNADSAFLITDERVAAYRDHVGEDRFVADLGQWRLVGLNAQLLDSGLDELEAEQWDWLEGQLQPELFEGRHAAMFLHKPLLHSDPHPAEHDVAIRYVRPNGRERLLSLFERVGTKLVVSGHVHQYRRHQVRGAEHVWAPTAWATLPDSIQEQVGERWVGGLDLTLDDDGTIGVEPLSEGIGQHVLIDTIPNPYGAH